jgi:phospholipid transport system substrate-binding protein
MQNTVAAWLLVAVAAAAPPATPRDVVQGAVTRVVTAVERLQVSRPEHEQAGRPDAERARSEIRRVATDLFDFEELARRALSQHWARRTPAEQAEFTRLFTGLLEQSYVGKIAAYSGERILYTGESVDGRYATVRSRIITRRKTETALDYRLHLRDGRWKVYDVVVDGVSFVSTWRSEFNRIIRASSFKELVSRLRKKQVEIRTVGVQG